MLDIIVVFIDQLLPVNFVLSSTAILIVGLCLPYVFTSARVSAWHIVDP